MSASHSAQPGQNPLDYVRALLRLERRSIWLILLFSIVIGLLTLATPVAVQMLVNFVAFGGLMQALIVIGVLLLVFSITQAAMRCLNTYMAELLQRRVFVRAAVELGDRLPRVHRDAYDQGFGAGAVNRFFDVLTIQKAGSALLLDGIAVVLQTLIGLIVLGFYHPILLAFDLVVIVAIIVILFVLGRGAVRTALTESTAKFAVADALEEIANQPVAFKQADAASAGLARADERAQVYLDARRQHFRIVFRQVASAFALQAIAGSALLTIGGWLVMQNELTLGQLVAAELIIALVLDSFAKFGRKLESVYDIVAASNKIGLLMDTAREREGGHRLEERAGPMQVRIESLRFRYPGADSRLGPISMVIEPGEIVVFEGCRASGKTTLAEILYGQREPTAGFVEVDGYDLRALDLMAFRSRVAFVHSSPVLADTILENVTLGRSDVGVSDARRALDEVGLLNEIRRLPDGVDTELVGCGRPLSSGSIDLLLLARALAGSPRLVIIDDMLDQIDASSRDVVLQALASRSGRTTTIVFTRGDWEHHAVRRLRLEQIAVAAGADLDGSPE